jgi:primosomal protein N''
MKKLVSFLVQQNEQSRLQQNKIREQNKQLIYEVQELKQTIDDLRMAHEQGNEQESEKVTSLYEKLMATQKSVEEVASAMEAEKSKSIWQKLFGK